jgi:hypothetical protein
VGQAVEPAGRTSADTPPRSESLDLSFAGWEGFVLSKTMSSSWGELKDRLAGAGVATTCTLLAALWPSDHVVFDWRVHAAANGLRLVGDLQPSAGIESESTESAPLALECYDKIRGWILEAAADLRCAPSAVERPLYRLSQKVKASERKRTWLEYGSAVLDKVPTRDVPEASGDEDDAPDA